MSPDTDPRPVIVFDGVCVLCNGWVRFLLRHDRRAHFRFAAMQTARGRALLLQHGMDPDDPVSFLLVEAGNAWSDTGLGGLWRLTTALRAVPRPLRDHMYRWLARNRYRWFGRRDSCLLPPPEQADRFLA